MKIILVSYIGLLTNKSDLCLDMYSCFKCCHFATGSQTVFTAVNKIRMRENPNNIQRKFHEPKHLSRTPSLLILKQETVENACVRQDTTIKWYMMHLPVIKLHTELMFMLLVAGHVGCYFLEMPGGYCTYFPVGTEHDDVIKWKQFPRYWPFVREIYRLPVNFPHKGQGRGALMFFFDLRLNKRLSEHSWSWCLSIDICLSTNHYSDVTWAVVRLTSPSNPPFVIRLV